MTLIFIVAIIWIASALARASKEAKRQREIDCQHREQAARSAELARMTAEWRQRQAEAKIETQRLIALEREQMRQAREQEKMEKEQQRQAEVLAKHEEQIAKLEHRMGIAEGEIEFQAQQIARLREHMEYAETERDACVYGSTRFFQWDKKCMALEKQIHTAEARLSKAEFEKSFCEDKLAS